MNLKNIGIAAGILGAGIVAGTLGTLDLGGGEDPIPVEEDTFEFTEAQKADQVIRSGAGKLIRMARSNITVAPDAATVDTELGKVVELDEPKGVCNVIIDARAIRVSLLYEDPEMGNREVPNIAALRPYMGKVSWPVKIQGSKDGTGSWLWNGLFKDADCKIIADMDNAYIGSTIREFLLKDPQLQARLLRTKGRCESKDEEGKVKTIDCTVPVGDPRAIAGERIFVPHGWAGAEHDINFLGSTAGIVESRIESVAKEEPIPIN